jgi:uncharacterized protein YukE
MSEPTDPIAQLVAKWREQAAVQGLHSPYVHGWDSAKLNCADELEAIADALRAQRTEGRPPEADEVSDGEIRRRLHAARPKVSIVTPVVADEMRHTITALDTQLSERNSQVADLQSQIETLQKENERLKADIRALSM